MMNPAVAFSSGGVMRGGRWLHMFGHSTLSSARLKHPEYVQPPVPAKDHGFYRPIEIVGTTDTRVEGINIAPPSALGEPQLLWGHANARIRNLTFENVGVAGQPVRDAASFRTNEHVSGLTFKRTTISEP